MKTVDTHPTKIIFLMFFHLFLIQVIGRLEIGGEGCEGPQLAHWKEIQVRN